PRLANRRRHYLDALRCAHLTSPILSRHEMTMTRTSTRASLLRRLTITAPLLAGGPVAIARAAPGCDSAMAPTVAPTVVEDAQAAFRAGVDLYTAGDYPAALEEFERAYRLAPTYKILFNLAQVAYQRRDYVLASRYFNRYLDEGGDAI